MICMFILFKIIVNKGIKLYNQDDPDIISVEKAFDYVE